MTTTYTAEEVSHHNSEENLWMIIHGGVYDVTKFLSEHPGGEEVLLKLGGQDGTTCFDDIGHTTEAIQLRERYRIGEVGTSGVNNSGPSRPDDTPKDNTEWMIEKDKQKPSPLLPIFVGILAIIYASLFYYLP
ncbi:cytochrome b5-like [Diachasmimorpha longicaudata]|uniref:cytochrome b5-like n=1 Tax=Diachasmimorpha longicaudata TaxID=58733 RepID=UPI0030B8BDE8